MIFANKQLEDKKYVENYNIKKSANVFMVYHLKGGAGSETGATQQMTELSVTPGGPVPVIHTASDFLDLGSSAGSSPASTSGTLATSSGSRGLAITGLFETEWRGCLDNLVMNSASGQLAPGKQLYTMAQNVTTLPAC